MRSYFHYSNHKIEEHRGEDAGHLTVQALVMRANALAAELERVTSKGVRPHNLRWCINLIPCCTVWITRKGGRTP